jgi:hypothetical protein
VVVGVKSPVAQRPLEQLKAFVFQHTCDSPVAVSGHIGSS